MFSVSESFRDVWGAVMILCLAALLAAVCPISAIAADPKTIQSGCPFYVAKPFNREKPEEVIGYYLQAGPPTPST